MIVKTKINGKIIMAQTIYYVYENEGDIKDDKSCLTTSDFKFAERYCKQETLKKT